MVMVIWLIWFWVLINIIVKQRCMLHYFFFLNSNPEQNLLALQKQVNEEVLKLPRQTEKKVV